VSTGRVLVIVGGFRCLQVECRCLVVRGRYLVVDWRKLVVGGWIKVYGDWEQVSACMILMVWSSFCQMAGSRYLVVGSSELVV
jgi:hypothetical protein